MGIRWTMESLLWLMEKKAASCSGMLRTVGGQAGEKQDISESSGPILQLFMDFVGLLEWLVFRLDSSDRKFKYFN